MRSPIGAFLQEERRRNVVRLFLRPITEQYREPSTPKCPQGRDFASRRRIIRVRKGCELRSFSNSFAS